MNNFKILILNDSLDNIKKVSYLDDSEHDIIILRAPGADVALIVTINKIPN